jgi:hypothetical protein
LPNELSAYGRSQIEGIALPLRRTRKAPRVSACLGLCLAVLWSCTPNLTNVRVYAQGLEATEQRVEPIANDTYQSCLRARRYGLLFVQLMLPSPNERLAYEASLPSYRAAVADYNQSLESCRKWVNLGKSYRAYHALLLAYAAALSQMVEGQSVDYGAAAKELATQTNSAAFALTGEQAAGFSDAAPNLAGAIARWGSSAYVQKHVRQALEEAGPHVAKILAALRFVLGDVYRAQLDLEGDAGASLYQALRIQGYGPIADVQWQQLKQQLAQRRALAVSLASELEHLEVATLALVRAAQDDGLDRDVLLNEVKPMLKDLLKVTVELSPVDWDPPAELMLPPPADDASSPAAGAAPPAASTP